MKNEENEEKCPDTERDPGPEPHPQCSERNENNAYCLKDKGHSGSHHWDS